MNSIRRLTFHNILDTDEAREYGGAVGSIKYQGEESDFVIALR